MGKVHDLLAYQKGFDLAMRIFRTIQGFPKSEQFGLSAQVRDSSRAVVVNLTEAYRRRRSQKYFEAKLNDCETELGETQAWLAFALACEYIEQETFDELNELAEEVARLLRYMANNPGKFM